MTTKVSLSDMELALWHERQKARTALRDKDTPDNRAWLAQINAAMDDLLDRWDRD